MIKSANDAGANATAYTTRVDMFIGMEWRSIELFELSMRLANEVSQQSPSLAIIDYVARCGLRTATPGCGAVDGKDNMMPIDGSGRIDLLCTVQNILINLVRAKKSGQLQLNPKLGIPEGRHQ